MTRRAKRIDERRPRDTVPLTSLDARAIAAIELFVRLLAQCGCETDAVLKEVTRACNQVPRHWVSNARAAPREISEATHVLTVWFSDPAYLDGTGMPRPLPLHGSGRSFETLVSGIDRRLDAQEVLTYLLKGRALCRLGSQYVPRRRVLSLRGVRGPNEFRNLRSLLAMLRTLEHNSRPRRHTPSWFEFSAENPRIPKRACAKFDEFVGVRAMRFVLDVDSELRRLELAYKPGEPTVRLGTGVYRFEEDLSESEDAAKVFGKARLARRISIPRNRRRRR